MRPARNQAGNLARVAVAATVLWLIWMEWRPAYFTLADNIAQISEATELTSLPPGTEFVLQGTVEPVVPPPQPWQGRFAYVHRERKDIPGGPSKEQRVVEVKNQRPALRFIWSGGVLLLTAENYGLEYAPQVERRFWPRKWLWTKRVDDWHQTSTGFRIGETACAYGRVTLGGQPQIEELMQWPLRESVARISAQNRLRWWLTTGFKTALTLGCLVYATPRWQAAPPTEEKQA